MLLGGPAWRVNACSSFLGAASQLNRVLVCVGVEKGFSVAKGNFLPWQHDWTADNLSENSFLRSEADVISVQLSSFAID